MRKGLARRAQVPERVEDLQLFGRMQQRLMVVRPVNIDQPLTQRAEKIESGWGPIHELPIGAASGEGALEQKLIVCARLKSIFLQILF